MDWLKWLQVAALVAACLKDIVKWPTNWEDRDAVQAWLHEFEPELAATISTAAGLIESGEESPHVVRAKLVAAVGCMGK